MSKSSEDFMDHDESKEITKRSSSTSLNKIEIRELSHTNIFEGRKIEILDHNLKEILLPYLITSPKKPIMPSFGDHMHLLAPLGFSFGDKSSAIWLLGIGGLAGAILYFLYIKWQKYFREKANYDRFENKDAWIEIISILEKHGNKIQ